MTGKNATATAQLRIEPLADHLEATTRIAGWYFEQWHRDGGPEVHARIIADVATGATCDRIPYQMVARIGDQFIGTAALVLREMAIFPDREFWLGGVYVDVPWRGVRIASVLVRHALHEAARLGITELWLQTEQLDGGLYAKFGFEPVETVFSEGRDVLVMVARQLPAQTDG